jgi:hypothetical protein
MGVIITFCTFLLIDKLIVGLDILTYCYTELPPPLPPAELFAPFYAPTPPTLLLFEDVFPAVFSEFARPFVPGTCYPFLACDAG